MKEWIIPDDFLDVETKLSADGQGYLKELVRCKNCKHSRMTYDGMCKSCELDTDADGFEITRYRDGNWFCADGEKLEK